MSGRLLKGGKCADPDIKSLEFIKLHYIILNGEPCGTAIIKATPSPSLNIHPFIIHESKQFTPKPIESMNCRSRNHNCKSLQFLQCKKKIKSQSFRRGDPSKVKSSAKYVSALFIKSDANLFLCPETCSLDMTANR